MNKMNKAKTVVILFPWPGLGGEIAEKFLASDYQVILITEEKDPAGSFKEQIQKYQNKLTIQNLEFSTNHIWLQLSEHTKAQILSAPVIIHFAGSDYLQLKTQSINDDWRINQPDHTKLTFEFVDFLLSKMEDNPEKLWFNLVVGMGAQKDQGVIYCQTRYAITGFSKIIELNPKLSNINVLNICLTYFKHRKNHQKVHHCSHCLTEKLNDLLLMLDEEGSLSDYLLLKSEQYFQKQLT